MCKIDEIGKAEDTISQLSQGCYKNTPINTDSFFISPTILLTSTYEVIRNKRKQKPHIGILTGIARFCPSPVRI